MPAVVDHGFNGSAVTVGTSNIGPLTSFRHTDNAATARTSGADSATDGHTFVAGRHNESIAMGFLGSRAPSPGTAVAISAVLTDGTSFSGTGCITQVRVSGRKDGAIEGNLTARPTPLTGSVVSAVSATNLGFNGSTLTFNSVVYSAGASTIGLNSLTYEGNCAEAEDSGAGDTSVLVSPGKPDETITMEVMGGATITVGARALLVLSWTDGGSMPSSYWQCMTLDDGGEVDGNITTTYTFKRCKSATA